MTFNLRAKCAISETRQNSFVYGMSKYSTGRRKPRRIESLVKRASAEQPIPHYW